MPISESPSALRKPERHPGDVGYTVGEVAIALRPGLKGIKGFGDLGSVHLVFSASEVFAGVPVSD